jgi:predicted regulator of Ras-like GTPase activity (Roadblock/LC7/MglB family)
MLVFAIAAICQSWPEAVRQEVEQFNLGGASVAIPMSRLDAGMKVGRVVFKWSELIAWLNTPSPAQTSQGTADVELPLSVVAPLFIGRYRAGVPRKVVTVGENIPDLFGGATKPAAAAPTPAPAPVVAVPVAAPAVAVPAAAAPATVHSALGELFGQPSKDEWTPQEIVQQIAALPGVSGGLLATADGLLVAGQVAPPLNNETLAAFLPQILGRVSSYSQEVSLGTLRAVTISTDSALCAMFKAGTLYMAALSKPGQSLPEATLLRVAAQLAKRNQ